MKQLPGYVFVQMRCFKRIECGRFGELRHAFTLIELLVIVFTVVVILLLFVPALVWQHRRAAAKTCENNLKQIGLAFKTWAVDQSDSFCTGVSTNSGGTLELANSGQAFVHFRAMSNELGGSEILGCPRDKEKSRATNFDLALSDYNASYFVSVDTKDIYPQMLLSGDRNLTLQDCTVRSGLLILTTNSFPLGWSKTIHRSCGNVLFGDGSVTFVDSNELARKARQQGCDTNRLAIP